jgi:hemolysin III
MKWGILIAQWTLVLLGIIFKIFFVNAPRVIGTSIYLLMGWMVIIPFRSIINAMPHGVFMFLLWGGILYTVGAVIYAIKKPDPLPDYFGFHEIFHIFVVAGALFHLMMLFASLTA